MSHAPAMIFVYCSLVVFVAYIAWLFLRSLRGR